MTSNSIGNSAGNLAPKFEAFRKRVASEAHNYIKNGWRLVRVEHLAKRPIDGADWQHKTINTVDDLARLTLKDCNLGVLLGPQSNLIDLECDSQEAEQDLRKLFGYLPDCPCFQSARGRHYLFQFDDRLPTTAKIMYGALECRLGNDKAAQSLLPPSITYKGDNDKPEIVVRQWLKYPHTVPPRLPDEVVEKLVEAHDKRHAHKTTTRANWSGDYITGERWQENYDKDLRTFDLPAFCEANNLHCYPTGQDKYDVTCPWHDQHSAGTGYTAGIKHEPGRCPVFNCFHSHCTGKTFEDYCHHYGKEAVEAHCSAEYTPNVFRRMEREFAAMYDGVADETYNAAKRPTEPPTTSQEPIEVQEPDDLLTGPTEEINVQAHLAGENLAKAPVVIEQQTNKAPATVLCEAGGYKSNPLFAYLWQGNHGQYLDDVKRQKRIDTTNDALQYLPDCEYFRNYLAYVLPTTDAPVMFHVASALSVASHLVNRKAWLQEGLDRVYPNLWIGCLAESGGRKSAGINPARNLISNDLIYGQTLPDSFTWAALMRDLGIPYKDDSSQDDLPTLSEVRLMCQDHERHNPYYTQGVGYFHFGELATLLTTLNKSYNEEALSTITDWYEGPEYRTKKTTTQGQFYFHRPFISMLGASTVDWLIANSKESWAKGGFMPRWLFVTGSRDYTLPFRDTSAVSRDKVEGCLEVFRQYQGEVVFSQDAKDFYASWLVAFNRAGQGKPDLLALWQARLAVYVFKVAMIFEAATSGKRVISLDSIRRASLFIDHVTSTLVRLLEEELAYDPFSQMRNKVVKYMRDHGGRVLHKDLLNGVRGINAKAMRELAQDLVERGQVIIDNSKISGNGKPTTYYVLAC